MSNSYDRTTEVPSITSIVVTTVVTALTGGATVWVFTGPVFDGRHLMGFLLGLVATIILFTQTVGRMMLREEARRRGWTTVGTWVHPEKGPMVVNAQGWPSHELYRLLVQLEEDGYVPSGDKQTQVLRERLMLSD